MTECIGGWTIETLRQHISGLAAEQEKRLDERFISQEEARRLAATEFAQYRISSNEWRGALDDSRKSMVPRAEWDTAHRQLEERLEAQLLVRDARMDGNDRERNMLSQRLVRIESRAGYVSLGVIMSAASLLVAIAVGALTLLIHGLHG